MWQPVAKTMAVDTRQPRVRVYAAPQWLRPGVGEPRLTPIADLSTIEHDAKTLAFRVSVSGGEWIEFAPADIPAMKTADARPIVGRAGHFGHSLAASLAPRIIAYRVEMSPAVVPVNHGWQMAIIDGEAIVVSIADWIRRLGADNVRISPERIDLDLRAAKTGAGPGGRIDLDPTVDVGTLAAKSWLAWGGPWPTVRETDQFDHLTTSNNYVEIGVVGGLGPYIERAALRFDLGGMKAASQAVLHVRLSGATGLTVSDAHVSGPCGWSGLMNQKADYKDIYDAYSGDSAIGTLTADGDRGSIDVTDAFNARLNTNLDLGMADNPHDVSDSNPGSGQTFFAIFHATGDDAPYIEAAYRSVYRVYRGKGGITNVDFGTPLAEVVTTSTSLAGLGHDAGERYTYAVRPVREDTLECPDISCATEAVFDNTGDWVGNRPAPVEDISAEAIAGGKIRLRWSYRTPRGGSAPNDFGVYYGTSPEITPGSPDATESYTKDKTYTKDLTLSGGTTYWLAVTARTSAPVESALSRIVGPIVADSAAPDAPAAFVSQTW
jgi:hypothetical protein